MARNATRRRKGSAVPPTPSTVVDSTTATTRSNPIRNPLLPPPAPANDVVISQIDARPHLEGAASSGTLSRASSTVISALAQSTIPAWASTAVMVSLIFGGCCSNVFALEAIVKAEPHSGHLITLAQFLLVAAEGFVYHFDAKSPTLLKPNQIPLHRWMIQILLFFSVSVLNNFAFGYNISVPVHIILRSGGSMTTMLIGWIWGKRYSPIQVLSVTLLTVGCIMSAMGDSRGMGETEQSMSRFLTGLAILFIAQVLSAFMGLFIENTYAKYGNNYREGLFYTHALSLPLFLLFSRSIQAQFLHLLSSAPLPAQPYLPPIVNATIITRMPRQLLFLILNALTQYVCIRGVNILGSLSSALTVTIVLNIRKLVSLLLSIWLFGNTLSPRVSSGAAIVFLGGFLYGLESQRQSRLIKAAQAAKKQ